MTSVTEQSESKLKLYSAVAGEGNQKLSIANVLFDLSPVSEKIRNIYFEMRLGEETLYIEVERDVFDSEKIDSFFSIFEPLEQYESFLDLEQENLVCSFNDKLTQCELVKGQLSCDVYLEKPEDALEQLGESNKFWQKKKRIFKYRQSRPNGEYGLKTYIKSVEASESTVSFVVEGLFSDKCWKADIETLVQQKGTDMLATVGGNVELLEGTEVYVFREPKIPLAVRDGLLDTDELWRLMTTTEYQDNFNLVEIEEEQENKESENKSLKQKFSKLFSL